ncbi:MAG: hypothetical protein II734_03515 [Paludibacteraceae bacterium]|nr:hypothetical protein [Paludibacteraceae bacterium]
MKKVFLFIAILACSLPAVAQEKCDYCHGSGQEARPCAFCGGNGYRECDFCLGKKEVRCNMCQGSGEIVCAHCRGRGGVQIKDEWRECQYCDGKGTPQCETCKGTGMKVCWKCEGAGEYVCNQCNGSKVNMWSCTHCNGTGYVKTQAKNSNDAPPAAITHGYSGTFKIDVQPGDTKEDIMRKATQARVRHRANMIEQSLKQSK